MSKKLLLGISLLTMLAMGGCSYYGKPILKGYYASEPVGIYTVELSFQPDDSTFVEYIDNREVDRGEYESLDENQYLLKGEVKQTKIKLEDDNSFEISIDKINDSKAIKIKFANGTPQYFEQQFDDIEKYKELYNWVKIDI